MSQQRRLPERAGDCDFPTMDISKNVIPDLTSPIRSADECVTLEDVLYILEVDLVIRADWTLASLGSNRIPELARTAS
jgi:hypothetical protein